MFWRPRRTARHQTGASRCECDLVRHSFATHLLEAEKQQCFPHNCQAPSKAPMGMNTPVAKHNPQFLINIMHWLAVVIFFRARR